MALDLRKGLGDIKLPSLPWSKLSKLTTPRKVLIAVGLVVALWGSFVWFFYLPQQENIAKLDNDLRSAKQKLDRLKKVERNLREFRKKFKDTEVQFKEALQLLPDKEEIPALLKSVSNLGATSGLEFILFQPQKEVNRNFYAEIPLKLELSGPYHNVAAFFDQVSRLSRIVNIGDMQMTEQSRGKTGSDVIVLKTNCTATTYKFVEVKEEPKKAGGKKKGKK